MQRDGPARRFLRLLHLVVVGAMGGLEYERYLEHARSRHCDRPALGRAEYFRLKRSKEGGRPSQRCC